MTRGTLMMDANQVWDVDEAIAAMRELAAFDPWWIEEPTSPDDVLGHARIREAVAPIEVATGEHVQNRIIFKQLLQAGAIDVLQIDACRVAGVNEVIAILLLAAKFGVPVCPHAGGVGLCEYVQHLAAFDYLSVSGSTEGRSSSGSTTFMSISCIRPWSSTGTTCYPRRPATASRCTPRRLPTTSTHTGGSGRATRSLVD